MVPDVILATGTPAVEALQRATRTIPIVFVAVVDPVGAGLVANLARPGGNTTGFSLYEYGQSGKSLELLKQIAPPVTRVAVLRDSANPAEIGQLAAIQTAAPSLGVELSPVGLREAGEIERAITEFARVANGDKGDLRKAWHCAGPLFHLHDWVYAKHKASIDGK